MATWQLPAAVLGGAAVGGGAFLLVREALPAVPALGPALRRLHESPTDSAGSSTSLLSGVARRIRVPSRDLALLGRTREQYLLSLLLSALIGLATPPVAGFIFAAAGIRLPVTIPVAAGLVFAVLFVVVAHRDVVEKAASARAEFVRAVCTYLDLVALQLAAAHGPVQALEQAATVCDGWVFQRIREALLRAQLQMRFPWAELRLMSQEIGVAELGDVGAIMQSSGTEGAQVQQTLREQADSLRDQIRTTDLAKAESITSRLDIPGAALVFVLVLFVLYPFMTRI
ncbi:type II secretion system F family protein [Cryptosporangium japonicum]|uniref:type II secretion system F family protein n=1 Tax=Cryptosporangium japonicum TaxID=80872 RepID=UPI0031E32096